MIDSEDNALEDTALLAEHRKAINYSDQESQNDDEAKTPEIHTYLESTWTVWPHSKLSPTVSTADDASSSWYNDNNPVNSPNSRRPQNLQIRELTPHTDISEFESRTNHPDESPAFGFRGNFDEPVPSDFGEFDASDLNVFSDIPTIVCSTICVCTLLILMIVMVTLSIMASHDIHAVNLPHATATVEMTIVSTKYAYSDFVKSQLISDVITEAFITATNMDRGGESKEMVNIQYSKTDPLFGNDAQHHTKVTLTADIPTEMAMDKLLSSMIYEERVEIKGDGTRDSVFLSVQSHPSTVVTEIRSGYKREYLNELQSQFESHIDAQMSVWNSGHQFEFPIVCTAQTGSSQMARGAVVEVIQHTSSMKEWPWGDLEVHIDVEPVGEFYVGTTLGMSFMVKTEFTHHHILCDMKKRVRKYMEKMMARDKSSSFLRRLNPFQIKIAPHTVRCCVAADGVIEHDLPANQCAGHQGERDCKWFEDGQGRDEAFL